MPEHTAKIVLDSVSRSGSRITTFELRYWLAIHAELLMHRQAARSVSSNRATPFSVTVRQVETDPFIPFSLGKAQKGQQSGEELNGVDRERARDIIKEMSEYCVAQCNKLDALGLHKSITNRYLAPWQMVTVVFTATTFDNFFRLRCHEDAEKHFQDLAFKMRQAYLTSVPQILEDGEYHLPYVRDDERGKPLPDMVKHSIARCARTSYDKQGKLSTIEDDCGLINTLTGDGTRPAHSNPFEHVAIASCNPNRQSGPFRGWVQYREVIGL